MKQVLIRRGQVVVEDVPAPLCEPGTVLVRVAHSCISAGTELSGISAGATPLWQRAVRQPRKVKRVLDVARNDGLASARTLVEGPLTTGEATGYSAAGIVIEVGAGVPDLVAGDRVACAGAQAAYHAQTIRIPRNLAVPVPDSLGLAEASTVTLGAIALQGVRRAAPTIGETFVVIGLGILGQLTAQILRAAGCRVIGTDLDPTRVRLATGLGMDMALAADGSGDIDQVSRLTDGVGADAVIITASTPSDEVVSNAFRMCRKKGRVVLVGDVGLDLNRADFYQKELDFLVSTSYGPGRYDRNYEERGLDYPVGYVRWTENRNMSEYLRLLAEGRIKLTSLIGATFDIGDASGAYEALRSGEGRPIIVLLSYGDQAVEADERVVPNPNHRPARAATIGVALVGAGTFAKGVHLPNIRALRDTLRMQAVVSRTGHNAMATARLFDAAYATTDFDQVLEDPAVDLVIIATRHDLHSSLALRALRHGKHVLVEKPLALNREELESIRAFYEEPGDSKPILMTGFNRRFSVYGRRIAELTRDRSNPMVISYRMNAGYIPPDHWVQTTEGGGRNLGEACHIYDLFTFLTEARQTGVQAEAIRPRSGYYGRTDNFATTIGFDDGSVATLTYTALGAAGHPKEQMDVFVDGKVISLDDYKRLTVAGASVKALATSAPEKGQRQELEALVLAIRDGGEWPIALWQQIQAAEIALRVEELITRPA
jgi:predicted dehydrogenase/threonine dehydrogenase-like Zn-dependent dehydrogenase